MEMSDVAGISKQREGQISNRETVGGVERATLQSSHITEWLFTVHEDVKRRALECFLETAKIALKGRNKKFQYILSDNSMRVMDIDGDDFAEADYGLVVDNGNGVQELNQKLDTLAQAALQNQTLSFSTIMKLFGSVSLAEKQRLVEKDERSIQERQAQAQQEQNELQQQQLEQQAALEEAKIQMQDMLNQRDNDTRIQVALINSQSRNQEEPEPEVEEYSEKDRAELQEKIREFDAKIKLDREKLNVQKEKNRVDAELKRKQINKPTKTAQ